jgi:hypothetical protein
MKLQCESVRLYKILAPGRHTKHIGFNNLRDPVALADRASTGNSP